MKDSKIFPDVYSSSVSCRNDNRLHPVNTSGEKHTYSNYKEE